MIYEKFEKLNDEKHGRVTSSLVGISRVTIGVGNGGRHPLPPNPVCSFPATGSPVGCFLIGIDAPIVGFDDREQSKIGEEGISAIVSDRSGIVLARVGVSARRSKARNRRRTKPSIDEKVRW
jgi:hypothetical protein